MEVEANRSFYDKNYKRLYSFILVIIKLVIGSVRFELTINVCLRVYLRKEESKKIF